MVSLRNVGRIMLRLLSVVLLMVIVTCSARTQSAATGRIAGTVAEPASDDLTEELLRGRTLMRYDAHAMMNRDTVPPYGLSEKAVVYIESAPYTASDADQQFPHPQLNQRQMLFRPLVLPVLAGTTVDFPNNDNLFHNVFSYSQPREFDLGRYPRGHVRSIRFDKPGIVKVYCDIHTYMYATILVLDNPYFALPEDDCSYSIGHIPPGTYKLSLWYGRKNIATKKVLVKEGETTVVNFEF
jgi:plastocyanin